MQFEDGNFPTAYGKSTSNLVHFCHGAPGAVPLFIEAHNYFKEQKYVFIALKCGELIWKKGILKKGNGLCHGISGNAYPFLSLYNCTQDKKWLYRALKFAEMMCDENIKCVVEKYEDP